MTWKHPRYLLITYVVLVALALSIVGLVLPDDAAWWDRLLLAWLPASVLTHAIAARLGWWTRTIQ